MKYQIILQESKVQFSAPSVVEKEELKETIVAETNELRFANYIIKCINQCEEEAIKSTYFIRVNEFSK